MCKVIMNFNAAFAAAQLICIARHHQQQQMRRSLAPAGLEEEE
jgi:hypothetical protein